ncbi:TPM domain-containing protein [Flagellimonas sp. S174]|uniref:TPM domain-containing protein n=1 Tax=Flagellimonas sp. S174 TaxID=3410790 RepID=UPI003BF52EE4
MLKTPILFFQMLFIAIGLSQENYPQLQEIVTDNALIFNQEQLMGMRAKLSQFETETTNQLVVLTIQRLGSETIEQYANGTFNQNKLGQVEKDNGILILFAKEDREVRIEVGYGLEPFITDAVASRIIRNTMIPEFKQENYFEGLDMATNQIIQFLNDPEALEEFKNEIDDESDMGLGFKIFIILFLSIFIAAGGFIFIKVYRNIIEVFRGMFIGKLGMLPGMFMAVFSLLPLGLSLVFVVMPLVFVVLIWEVDVSNYEYLLDQPSRILYLFGCILGLAMLLAVVKIRIKGKEDFKLSFFKSNKKYLSKTFSSGGTHSFGSSSSGGSSSSFSGGGGSSGGGGASGSW